MMYFADPNFILFLCSWIKGRIRKLLPPTKVLKLMQKDSAKGRWTVFLLKLTEHKLLKLTELECFFTVHI
jgi:hypothetical protein